MGRCLGYASESLSFSWGEDSKRETRESYNPLKSPTDFGVRKHYKLLWNKNSLNQTETGHGTCLRGWMWIATPDESRSSPAFTAMQFTTNTYGTGLYVNHSTEFF